MKRPNELPVAVILQKPLKTTLHKVFTYTFLVFLLFVVSACDRTCALPTVHHVHPELEIYFNNFKADALEHGYTSQLNMYCQVICEEIDGLYLGYADKANHTIAINTHYLNYPIMVEFILMHECGHYFFNMKHGDNFIMADGLSTEVVKEYMQNRGFYIKQFFNNEDDRISGSGFTRNKELSSKNSVQCILLD
jgi:hypothetical protein